MTYSYVIKKNLDSSVYSLSGQTVFIFDDVSNTLVIYKNTIDPTTVYDIFVTGSMNQGTVPGGKSLTYQFKI